MKTKTVITAAAVALTLVMPAAGYAATQATTPQPASYGAAMQQKAPEKHASLEKTTTQKNHHRKKHKTPAGAEKKSGDTATDWSDTGSDSGVKAPR